jgi:hypothetical protein
MMRYIQTMTLLLGLTLAIAPRADDVLTEGHMTSKLPEYHVADAAAPVVTEKNLVASERFWPYQTALTRAWRSLPVHSLGVLIRVENAGSARIDFGRDGLHDVPVPSTDLVERSNAIRLGKVEKAAPNFLLAIGPRLLDSRAAVVRAFPFADAAENHLFLCVFADPWRKEFETLVTALAPLRERAGVQTILFPQSHRPDSQVSGQLRAMKWTPPFVYAHLSEPYTHSLLDADTPLPAVLLQTGDGTVLFESRWSTDVVGKLTAAVNAASGEPPVASSTTAP